MTNTERLTLLDMFRTVPVESTLFALVPVVLALAQIANSVINGLAFTISVPFALGMVGFAAVLTSYRFAQFRRQQIERELLGLV